MRRAVTAGLLGLAVAFALGAGVPASATVPAVTLELTITDVRSDDGRVRVALYDQAERFPKGSGWSEIREVEIHHGVARAIFRSLPEGTYAIAFFHDENDNGKFDQGFLGVPLEGFGFSRDAKVVLGPPKFEEAALTLNAIGPRVQARARMRY